MTRSTSAYLKRSGMLLLSAAAVPMRRAGLAAVVDVDPQSL